MVVESSMVHYSTVNGDGSIFPIVSIVIVVLLLLFDDDEYYCYCSLLLGIDSWKQHCADGSS